MITKWNKLVGGCSYFCNDAIYGERPKKLNTWKAVSREVKIKISNLKEIKNSRPYYEISFQFKNVVFRDKKVIKNLVIERAGAGWFPS